MRSLNIVRLLSVLFLSSASFAQDSAPSEAVQLQNQIRTEGLEKSQVQDWLKTLTKEIGPRLTSSKRLLEAQEWALDEFKKMGLSAELEEWGTFPVGFDRGPCSGKVVSPIEKELTFHTSAWTLGTDGPKRGIAIAEPQTEEELEAVADKLAGAWIIRRVEIGRAHV